MRTISAKLALAALFSSIGLAQSPFYFTQPASPADMTAMATTIRTIVDIRDLNVDEAHRALVAQGPEEKMVVADWLFHQLDRPAGVNQSGPVAEYKIPGPKSDVVKIIPIASSASNADLTAMITAIRTVLDIQRLFPFEARKAIVARATAEQIAGVDWLVSQLSPTEGKAPTADSPAYPSPIAALMKVPEQDPVIRVFRMDPSILNSALTATVTAIRTTADLARLFPYEAGRAIIAAGPADKMALAEWIVHERNQPPDAPATHETTLAGVNDGAVRMFYFAPEKSSADMTALATQIRTKTGIARIFPFTGPAAVVLRGRPDQMSLAETLVAEYATAAR